MLTDVNVHSCTRNARGVRDFVTNGARMVNRGSTFEPPNPWAAWLDAWIKDQRTEQNVQWTAADLARKLGIERANVRRWITKGHAPEPRYLRQVARVVGLPIEKLLELLEASAALAEEKRNATAARHERVKKLLPHLSGAKKKRPGGREAGGKG
jgi:transcriptional regulator with XRE-family HTH domain